MLVLGVHGGRKLEYEDNRTGFALHDSAAVLVRDGEVLSAIEEERLNRIKHTNCFPARAIRRCLSEHGLRLEDVDLIVTNHAESTLDVVSKTEFLNDPRRKGRPGGAAMLGELFRREFGVDVTDKIRFCGHHLAHAWSAYGASGFERSLIVVLDGDGDNKSGMVLLAEGQRLIKLRVYELGQSLGNFYTEVIKLLGYNRFDEYKVMGLAPYGDPAVYAPLFEKCYRLLPGGNYSLADPLTFLTHFDAAGFVAQARRKGEPFTRAHMDLGAALQAALEKIVMHVVGHYRKETRQSSLCLAGGVAHNCTLNGKILYSGLFENVFVQPAAHDAGGTIGAAWSVLSEQRPAARPRKPEHLFWGTDVPDDGEVGRELEAWGDFLTFERVGDICQRTARLVADGAVVGWVQGRSEFGPRALGNRSIIADPRPASNKLLINQMVKKREAYRPFAPSVLEEKVGEYFVVPESRTTFPFMIFVLEVREHVRELLGAVTHVDGTARVQTVSRETNPKYWDLIHEFEKITGVPIVLNTSFNNNAEPIVDSVPEAIACFLTTGLNYLAVGNYVVSKKEPTLSAEAARALVPSLPLSRRLLRRSAASADGVARLVYEIQGTANRHFSQPDIEVSAEAFLVLEAADGRKDISSLLGAAGVREAKRALEVVEELTELWARRAIDLRPAGAGA
jgi:carbamoyltransferase